MAALLLFAARPAPAEDIGVTAEVSSRSIDLQTAVELKITVSGEQNIPPMKLPDIDGFDAQYAGASRGVTIVNGQYSSSVSFIYNLFPKRAGTLKIPSLTVHINGRDFVTEEITIEVGSQPSAGAAPSGPGDLSGKIFMAVKIPKTQAYFNERVPVKMFLYVGKIEVRDIQYPKVSGDGLQTGEMQEAKQFQQVVEGVRYDVVEFDTYVYPVRTGEIEINAELDASVLYQIAGDHSRSRIGSVFDDPFFGELLGRHEKRPLTVKAPPAKLEVLPLPPYTQKEPPFSGAVGSFDFQAEVGPETVRAGDPLTLRMTIKGDGDLSVVKFPRLPGSSLYKLYDPNIKEEDGRKIFEQVVIPASVELKEIPALDFVYFDPDLKSYRTVSGGPFAVTVEPPAEGETLQIVGGESAAVEQLKASEAVGSDIVFIKESPGKIRKIGQVFYQSPGFWAALAFILFFWAGGVVFVSRLQRLQTDAAYAKRLKAPKKAKEGLRKAGRLLAQASAQEFYTQVYATLKDYLHHKLGMPQGAVTRQAVCSHESIKALDPGVSAGLGRLFDECDAARYASLDAGRQQRQEALRLLGEVIDAMERGIK